MSIPTAKKQELIDWIEELEDKALINDLRAIKDDHRSSLEWDNLPHQVKKRYPDRPSPGKSRKRINQ